MDLAFHGDLPKVDRLVVVNNIFGEGRYGWLGTDTGSGVETLDAYVNDWTFAGNAIYRQTWSYPAGNFFPSDLAAVGFVNAPGGNYRLANDSPLKGVGVGGTDLGADIDTIEALTAGVR